MMMMMMMMMVVVVVVVIVVMMAVVVQRLAGQPSSGDALVADRVGNHSGAASHHSRVS